MLDNIKKFKKPAIRGILYKKFHKEEVVVKPKTRAGQVLLSMRRGGRTKFRLAPVRSLLTLPAPSEIRSNNIIYPLIRPYAYANIKYDTKENVLVYDVIEPRLDEKEKYVLGKLHEGLIQIIDVSLGDIKEKEKMLAFLEKGIDRLIDEYDFKLSEKEYIKIMYYIFRDLVGLNRIEPLLNDPYIEDVGCDGIGIPVYIVHQKFGSVKTNIVYADAKELRDFVTKLAERCDRYISYADPLLDGTLPGGTRVQASLASDVTTRGPTFSIRKFKEEPLSPVDMIRLNTASAEMLAYIWFLVENGANILIAGGVSTGKTSFLNSVSFFIPPEAKIVSIEDTRELNLPHENWIPGVARTGFTGSGVGEVTMYELLRESFRQNPDYLIVGEIRGKEAYVMFQGMASIPGNEKVAVLNDDHLKFIPIGELENKIYKTFTIDAETGKINVAPIKARVIHRPQDTLYRITTKSGREVVTTAYHSLFSFDNGIRAIEAGKFKKGDVIIVPGRIPAGFADANFLDLTELDGIRIFAPEYFKLAAKKLGFEKASKICGVKSISDYYANFKRARPAGMKAEKFFKLMKEAEIEADKSKMHVKFLRKSRVYPAMLKITPEFLRLLGYYISEGSLNKSGRNSRICLYSKNKEILDDMRKCIKSLGDIKTRERITEGYGTCTEISFNHKVLFEFLLQKCGKYSSNKKIPDFMYGLSKEKIGAFLSALFSGDGYFSKTKFGYYTSSKELTNGLAHLLLVYGIVARIVTKESRNYTDKHEYDVMFYRREEREEFLKFVEPVGKRAKIVDTKIVKKKDKYKDVFLDTIKSIEKIELEKPVPVYDLVVPGTQNFLGGFGGVGLHNSGHPSISTIHAGGVDDLMKRLQTRPINLSAGLIESLDLVVVMVHAREKGKSARRVKEMVEIESIDINTGAPLTTKSFVWLPAEDAFEYRSNSWLLSKVSTEKGIPMNTIIKEITRRKKFLAWMLENNITAMEEVAKHIATYHRSPENVSRLLAGERLRDEDIL